MTKKKSTKAAQTIRRTVKVRQPSGDLVSVQVAATVRRPKNVKLTPELLSSMVQSKAASSGGQWDGKRVKGAREGKDPKGVKLRIIRWRNPERKGKAKGWRSGSQAEAWGSLRRPLEKAKFDIRQVGRHKGANSK